MIADRRSITSTWHSGKKKKVKLVIRGIWFSIQENLLYSSYLHQNHLPSIQIKFPPSLKLVQAVIKRLMGSNPLITALLHSSTWSVDMVVKEKKHHKRNNEIESLACLIPKIFKVDAQTLPYLQKKYSFSASMSGWIIEAFRSLNRNMIKWWVI